MAVHQPKAAKHGKPNPPPKNPSAATKESLKNGSDRLWAELIHMIDNYAVASIAESWKGGGDPQDVDVLEMRLKLTRLELEAHIAKMRRDLE